MSIYNEGGFDVEFKSDNSPLTRADKAAHRIIKEELEKTGIPILSEEGKHLSYEERKDWEKLWIVDPIDGTKEFIKKSGEFTINIALIEQQKPVLGVVYAPALKVIYWGSKSGSYKLANVTCFDDFQSSFKNKQKLPLKSDTKNFTIAASKSHLTEKTKNFIEKQRREYPNVEVISKGSSLKICMVAEGVLDCYPRFGTTMEWDTAAGHAVCSYAHAEIQDWNQIPLLYNKKDLRNSDFICVSAHS
ncbi:3'(2'),5'-bisphosphate nucleotidase CysQ [Zunongwangia sp. HGR-M22]|uniref:3'(2'),5'-bisphosphate nucleotidase CysQ n=1 Tax=Zunongwangia sp. HGR-M22 TaxID=3015168 RepID=UPI0022DD6659|nr:3'(2'),5'-bisphosphate nucleotidase CysQ [Zunongwangia sp. HGR-M22]WBL25994.1 3'(2'),5'-bisphosphate nucleotidase CysQ [Zunongwangia sp. HGR-M22]